MYGDVFCNREPATLTSLEQQTVGSFSDESAFVFGLSPDSATSQLISSDPSSRQCSQPTSAILASYASAVDDKCKSASEYSHDGHEGSTASVVAADTESVINDLDSVPNVCWSFEDDNVEWSPWTRHQ
eukprot:5998838-Pyramimonas_sp.AAC.1